jgi:hypothetical protein
MLYIGGTNGGSNLSGTVKRVAYYRAARADAFLQAALAVPS